MSFNFVSVLVFVVYGAFTTVYSILALSYVQYIYVIFSSFSFTAYGILVLLYAAYWHSMFILYRDRTTSLIR